MTAAPDRCSSCGVLWSQHLSIAGTCREAGEYHATIKRILEWAKGRCECCEHTITDECDTCIHAYDLTEAVLPRGVDRWTPPKAWGLG